jgi:hypothetical protein
LATSKFRDKGLDEVESLLNEPTALAGKMER